MVAFANYSRMISFCLTLCDRRNCYSLTKSMEAIFLRPFYLFYLSLLLANRAGIWTERNAGQEESCPVFLRKEIQDEILNLIILALIVPWLSLLYLSRSTIRHSYSFFRMYEMERTKKV